jgi:hypothetical protein
MGLKNTKPHGLLFHPASGKPQTLIKIKNEIYCRQKAVTVRRGEENLRSHKASIMDVLSMLLVLFPKIYFKYK